MALFPAVKLAPGTAAAEAGLGERSGQGEGSLAVEIVVALAQGAEDSQSALAGDDLAPGAAFGSVGPGPVLLAQLEEVRNHPDHVTPVIGIVGLDHQKTRGQKSPVDVGQESRRDDPAMSLAGVVIGLGMVEVDLGDRGLGDVGGNESSSVLDNEPDIVKSTLVGSARGVADDHGQFVDCAVVVIRPGKRTAESEPPVAATKVKNDRASRPKNDVQSSGPGSGSRLTPVRAELASGRISPGIGTPNSYSTSPGCMGHSLSDQGGGANQGCSHAEGSTVILL